MPESESNRALAYEVPPALRNIRIVLVEPQIPGNIGSVARAMKTVGLQDLALVRPVPFRDSEEAYRFASGAHDLLESAREYDTLAEAAEDLHFLVGTTNRRRGGMLSQPIPMREAAQQIAAIAGRQRVGILFGREDFGLSSIELARCNLGAAIPMAVGMPSLNLSHAVQVAAQEVFVACLEPQPAPPPESAPVGAVEALISRFGELFQLLGSDALTHPAPQALDSLRCIFSRVGLQPRDVRTLHMVVRAMIRRLRQ
ncbi:MAG TPA: TrmJ/YjtD family RNA methyltransferase [Armatimonadota bacterium]|nr:TrmJ/YjtD family RNA methyltransferase [Armatimonadota bacterium]